MNIYMFMDEESKINEEMDSSLLIISEFNKRGYQVYVVTPQSIFINKENTLQVLGQKSKYINKNDNFYSKKKELKTPTENDLIIIRIDPPVDSTYIQLCQILTFSKSKVVNDPLCLINFSEKIIPNIIFDYQNTFITSNITSLSNWVKEEKIKKLVIKRMNDCGGKGIHLINISGDWIKQIQKIIDQEKVIVAQVYNENIVYGDKRFFLTQKKLIGSMNRIPPKGDFRANIHLGATPKSHTPTKSEMHTIKKIQSWMKENKIFICCIDMIGEIVTEVNITSPSGLPEINKVSKGTSEKILVSSILEEIGVK